MNTIFYRLKCLLTRLTANEIHYINGSDTLPPPLSADEEQRVFEALEAGDPKARQTLIEHNLRLFVYIAKKFESSGVGI